MKLDRFSPEALFLQWCRKNDYEPTEARRQEYFTQPRPIGDWSQSMSSPKEKQQPTRLDTIEAVLRKYRIPMSTVAHIHTERYDDDVEH